MTGFAQYAEAIHDELAELLPRVDAEAIEELVQAMMDAKRIFLFGQGRTGHVTRAFAVRLMHLGLDVHFPGDATTPPIKESDLCIVNSGTGDTRFAYHVAAAAREAGAKLATITAHPSARIGKLAHVLVKVPAPTKGERFGPSKSIQPPGSLFEQVLMLVLDAVVLMLMDRLGQSSEFMQERHANIE